jgi:2-methylcitrate dehydratase PrpD
MKPQPGPEIALHLTENLFQLSQAAYDPGVVEQAKKCLLDYIGVTLAGTGMYGEKTASLLQNLGGGAGNASLIGMGRKSSLEHAMWINGLHAHVAELDDGARFGMIHPGAPVLSALLPVAEMEQVSGKDLIRGMVTGYEAAIGLARTMQPYHYARGFHPTGTCGSLGAAAGIAAMLRFTKEQFKDALSAAAVAASGSLKVIEGTSELKPFNVSRAAVDGFMASAMGRAGFSGPADAFSGETGFLTMMAEKYDQEVLLQIGKGEPAIQKVYFKPYAACRHAHPAIEAAVILKNRHGLDWRCIASATVTTYSTVLGKHDHRKIEGINSAKMSIPFGVVIALATGGAGIEAFSDSHVTNKDFLSLTQKVRVLPSEELSALVPERRAAILEITAKDGNRYQERVDFPKGEPENPMSAEEIRKKFLDLAGNAKNPKPDPEKDNLVQVVFNMESQLPELFPLYR